ncbi:MAG: hypothetical protein AB7W59_11470 [Acidimicrobiia bacterium]
MTNIETDTEMLLRRRLRQLAAHRTAVPARRVSSVVKAPCEVPAPTTGELAHKGAEARQRRLGPRAAAVALAVAVASTTLLAGVVLRRAHEPPTTATSDPAAVTVIGSAIGPPATAVPPYLQLSGSAWEVTDISPDGTDTGWGKNSRLAPLPPGGSVARLTFEFVAGYAYSAMGPCEPSWITNGMGEPSSPSSQCSYPPPAGPDPYFVRQTLEYPTEVRVDGDTLTVMSRSADGSWAYGIRARRTGDATPQQLPKRWLANTTWAVGSITSVVPPVAGEDLAWMQVTTDSSAEIPTSGQGAGTAPVTLLDATPTCEGGMPAAADSSVLCAGHPAQQQAVDAVATLWAAASDVTLDRDGLLMANEYGELRARLLAVNASQILQPGTATASATTAMLHLPTTSGPHATRPDKETASPPTTNIGQSDAWRGQHDQLLAERQAVRDAFGTMYDEAAYVNPPDVYLSDPVDITGPGTYPIRFAMPAGTTLRGWSIQQPPDLVAIVMVEPISPVANPDGYLEATIRIDEIPDQPADLNYPGLTVWLT